MKIISHRGYWKTNQEKNTLQAFIRSFEFGFGTETDIRDFNGKLVISHDIPNKDSICILKLFECLNGRELPLALNIKADGLCDLLVKEIINYNIKNAFVFDMSVPDQKHYLNQSVVSVYTRMSEHERSPVFYKESDGIWLDSFSHLWFKEDEIMQMLLDKKKICIVSPELHKRSHIEFWKTLKESDIYNSENIILCTDLPVDACRFFKE